MGAASIQQACENSIRCQAQNTMDLSNMSGIVLEIEALTLAPKLLINRDLADRIMTCFWPVKVCIWMTIC